MSGSPDAASFLEACRAGDVERLRDLLAAHPDLVSARDEGGRTGLHHAVRHPEAVRLLLERGADPDAREAGDNATPLFGVAGPRALESARALLDAGADARGTGDAHELELIGWATVFDEPDRALVDLLVSHGARHHVFSAIALGDRALLRRIVEADPEALGRRLSEHEGRQTALHYVVAPPDGLLGGTFRTGDHYRTLELLIDLGAELEARDAKQRTPLELAMLRGDREAMRLLHAAGARFPEPAAAESGGVLAAGVRALTPMIPAADVEASIDWYRAAGFDLAACHEGEAGIDWASLVLGDVEIMLVPGADVGSGGISLWIRTDRIEAMYARLRGRQMAWARATLDGEPPEGPEIRFVQDLHTAFYGQREFAVLDPDGVEICFCQPLAEDERSATGEGA